MLGDTRGAPCREHSFLPARTPFQTGLPIHPERWLRQRRGWAGASTRGGLLGAPGAAPRGRPLPEEGCGPGRGSGSFPCCGHDGRADPPGSLPRGSHREGEGEERQGRRAAGKRGGCQALQTLPGARAQHPAALPGGRRHPQREIGVPCLCPPGARRSKGGAAQPDVGVSSCPLFPCSGPRGRERHWHRQPPPGTGSQPPGQGASSPHPPPPARAPRRRLLVPGSAPHSSLSCIATWWTLGPHSFSSPGRMGVAGCPLW